MVREHRVSRGPGRYVLEGVPRVHDYEGGKRCSEAFPFFSCLRAILEYQRAPFGCRFTAVPSVTCACTYGYVVGASGCGAFLSWAPAWDGDVLDMTDLSG